MALCYVMTTLLQDLGLCAYYKRRDKEAITLYIEACRGIVDKVLNLLLNLLALPVKKYKYWRRDKESITLEVESCRGIWDKVLSLLALLV